MTIRSKLFATVAIPMLSVSVAVPPSFAGTLSQPFEVAQSESEGSTEEILKKRRKQRQQAAEEQQQAEEPQAQQQSEEAPAETPRRKKRQVEQQQEESQPSADDEAARQAAEEKQRARAERKKRQQEEQQQQESQSSDNQEAEQAAEEKRKARAERRKRQAAEQEQQQEQAQPSGDDEEALKAAEERRKARAERKKRQDAEQQQQDEAQQDEAKPADDEEAIKAAQERRRKRAEEKARAEAEAKGEAQPDTAQQDEAKPADDEEAIKAAQERRRKRAEEKARAEAEAKGEAQPDTAQQDEAQPADDVEALKAAQERRRKRIEDKARAQGEDVDTEARDRKRRDRREPLPDVVDTRSKEEKQKVAEDPAATDETVVLPVEQGAAVLDSDKDADNAGDESVREKRRKKREQARAERQNIEAPESDAESQSLRKERRPSREVLEEAITERGRRVEQAPAFGLPEVIDALTGNDGRRPRFEEARNNRVVLDFGDQIIVRGDERARLRRNATESYYEELPRGRTREIIERPNGVRVITIYNRYGDVLQRTRIERDGEEYLMIYAPELEDGPRVPTYDVGYELPPMILPVPVDEYIIQTSTEPDRDYYEFLAEPPVEQVERVYTIDEVRSSARIRDKVRRIDLDTVTFATASAEVPLSQAKTLRKVADAMLEVIEKDPGETFFIEGHTDAVGSDESNLVLSDERAESVATLLSEVYDIPAENLVTQGYGERFLKVRTDGDEQQNRRVTIRRVTPLVRPVAQN